MPQTCNQKQTLTLAIFMQIKLFTYNTATYNQSNPTNQKMKQI